MRYRVKDYAVAVNTTIGRLMIYFNAPDYAYDSDLEVSLSDQLKESVRLVVDETAKIVFASSMQKDNILTIDTTAISGYGYRMLFNIPSGATVTTSDFFTLEFDFGESPKEMGSDAALLVDYFDVTEEADEELMTDQEITAAVDEMWANVFN